MAKNKKSKASKNSLATTNEQKKTNHLTWVVPSIFSFAAIVIAVQANITASQANKIYKDEINLTHRPYVWVGNYAYIDEENNTISVPTTVQLVVINSPARLVSESHRHYAIKGNEIIEIKNEEYSNRILYPSERNQDTYTIDQNTIDKCDKLLNNGYELFRESKIKYQMLSEEETYKYEAKWKFNKLKRSWVLTGCPIAN